MHMHIKNNIKNHVKNHIKKYKKQYNFVINDNMNNKRVFNKVEAGGRRQAAQRLDMIYHLLSFHKETPVRISFLYDFLYGFLYAYIYMYINIYVYIHIFFM